MDEDRMREAIAAEMGVKLYKLYTTGQAASMLKVNESTIKRWKRDGVTEYVLVGRKNIYYLGLHLVEMVMKGIGRRETCPDTESDGNSSSANTGSTAAPVPPRGIDAGTKADRSDVSVLARMTFSKPSGS